MYTYIYTADSGGGITMGAHTRERAHAADTRLAPTTHGCGDLYVRSYLHTHTYRQCVAVCFSVLQVVAVCHSVVQRVAAYYSVVQHVALCCNVL